MPLISFSQDDYRVKICKRSIKTKRVNKINYYAKYYKDYGKVDFEVRYLGETRKKYRITTIATFSGIAHHAISEIYVFNKDNEYVGRYRGFLYKELPDFLKNSTLFFINGENENCVKKNVTEIDLKDNIPQKIQVVCTRNGQMNYFFYKKE